MRQRVTERVGGVSANLVRASIHNRDTHALITLTKLIWCSNGTHHTHTVLSGALTVLSKDHLVLREMGVSIEECSHEWPSVS